MSDGVKGIGGPVYSSNTPPEGDKPSSPVISPKPQIPRAPGKAPKSILKNRNIQQTGTVKPQVNQQAREKMELVNQSQNLVAQLEHLLTRKQFIAHREALLEAIANPEALPEDFTVVYINEQGQEITVIPPAPQLQQNQELETRLRNSLKSRVHELDESLNDDDAEQINEDILTTSNKLEACNEQLAARQEQPLSTPTAPQRLFLASEFLTAPARQIPFPEEDTFALDEKTVAQTPKKQRFDDDQFREQWVDFYTHPDHKMPGQFYSLNDIRNLSDEEMETQHDYIQLLFPNEHISENNPGAPLLTLDLAALIQNTDELSKQALASVDQMLGFWGLERSGYDVTVDPGEASRHHKWNGSFDHNHKRITRMLDFLMKCGQFRLASNIEQKLQSHRIAENQIENSYWAIAVGRQPGESRPPIITSIPANQPTPSHKVHHYKDYVNAFPYDQYQSRDRIDFYHKDKPGFVFTNFYQPQQPITIDGDSWPTTEHYYQACKFTKSSTEWKHIQSLPDADAVYSYIYPNRPGDYTHIKYHLTDAQWRAKSDGVMMTALRAKATSVPEFRQALLDSGDKILFETSPKDSYWGTARNTTTGKVGKNVLGAMLMQVRDELNAGTL